MQFEKVTCILCDKNDTEPVFEKEKLVYVSCRQCGLIYVNPRLTGKSLEKIYKGSSIRSRWKKFLYSKRKADSFQNLDARFLRAEKLMYEVAKYKSGGRILDIGCNRGFLLATAVSWGWEAFGIEIVSWFPEVVSREFPMKTFSLPLRKIEPPFPDNYFNAITMIDIIEHLTNPLLDMKEIRRILSPDGFLLINTPDIGSAYARVLGKKWGSVNPQEHFFLFDRISLEKLAERAGFEVITIQASKGSIGEMEVHLRPKDVSQ